MACAMPAQTLAPQPYTGFTEQFGSPPLNVTALKRFPTTVACVLWQMMRVSEKVGLLDQDELAKPDRRPHARPHATCPITMQHVPLQINLFSAFNPTEVKSFPWSTYFMDLQYPR